MACRCSPQISAAGKQDVKKTKKKFLNDLKKKKSDVIYYLRFNILSIILNYNKIKDRGNL